MSNGQTTRGPRRDRHVALLVETSNAYARGLMAGVHKYVSERPGWSVYLAEHSRHETDFSWLEGWRGHGVLARIENDETAAYIRRLGLPTVDLSAAQLIPELPGVETDDRAIARLAVQHFTERGLRNFAFCGDERFRWSTKRSRWFAAQVLAQGAQAHSFELPLPGGRAMDRDRLADWLQQLPKPVGVLACYDVAGQEVLEACKLAGLPVPDDVAVLGVDNDQFMVNLTSPPLSSVQPDTIRTGYLAASLLAQLMEGQRLEPGLRLIEPLRIVPRQSSDILAVEDPLVAKALRYIRENAHTSIEVTQVLQHVALSRRSLDYRVLKAVGRTVHGEILRARMAHVAEMLTNSDRTLQQIAILLDFTHPEYMGVVFKKVTGKSPGQYRREAKELMHG